MRAEEKSGGAELALGPPSLLPSPGHFRVSPVTLPDSADAAGPVGSWEWSRCTLRKATMKKRPHPGGTAGSTHKGPTGRRETGLQSSGPSTGQVTVWE